MSVLLAYPSRGVRRWVVRFNEKGTLLLRGGHGCCHEYAQPHDALTVITDSGSFWDMSCLV